MRPILLGGLLLLLASAPLAVHAKCSYSSGGETSVSFSLPATITVPATATFGDPLWTTGQVSPLNPPTMECGFAGWFPETVTYGVVNSRGGYLTDNTIYATGVPGVGYRITHPTSYLTPYPFNSKSVTSTEFSVTSGLELVKTGPIASGSVLTAGELGKWRWGSLTPETFKLSNSVTFTTPSCTLVNNPKYVSLPTVSTGAFIGVGSVSGKTPFTIDLSCPAGMAVAKITMHTGTPDSHPGVVAPATGYAAGIGVQVLDANSNAVVFETQTAVNPNATASIPFFAQYFQTAPAVSGGNVKATVTFDIFYQ